MQYISVFLSPHASDMMDEVQGGPRIRKFVPAAWASGPHAQTLMARMLRPMVGPPFTRERIETPDGDFIDVDWGPETIPGSPIALILHGLEGSSKRRYVRNVCQQLIAQTIRPVVMNFRGCSGEPNRSLRFYHSGDTGDTSFLIQRIRHRCPSRPVGAIGFSLGGNVLLKLMGECDDGGARLLDAAVAISVPYDLALGSALLERTIMGRLYSAYFVRSLRRKVAAKVDRLSGELDLASIKKARTIRDFDERATVPLNGFKDAGDYYARCSSGAFIESVRVPTLLLHAEDDPFLPKDGVPVKAIRSNPHLHLAMQLRGGHVGFLEGPPWAPTFWAEEQAARFLGETLVGGLP